MMFHGPMDTRTAVITLFLIFYLAITSDGFANKNSRRRPNKSGHDEKGSSKLSNRGFQTPTSVKKGPPTSKKSTFSQQQQQQHYIRDTSDTTKRLLSWLEEEEVEGLDGTVLGYVPPSVASSCATSPISSSVSIQSDGQSEEKSFLRGIFADQDFSPGEYILAVPFVTTLLVQEEFQISSSETGTASSRTKTTTADEFELLAGNPQTGLKFMKKFLMNNDNDDVGTSIVVQEEKEEESSTTLSAQQPMKGKKYYQAYFDCIPMTTTDPNFDMTPDFWTLEEIRQLEVPSIVQSALSRKHTIQQLAEEEAQTTRLPHTTTTTGTNNNNNNKIGATHSILQHACWLIQTRAFTTYKKAVDLDGNEGLLSKVVLIPWMDFINSADSVTSHNAELQVVETKAYDESFYALIATKAIPKGTEIRIRYGTGQETAIDLFAKYGFLPPQPGRISGTKNKKALLKQLEGVSWSTSLEDDQARLDSDDGQGEPLRTILKFRILMKTIMSSVQ